MTKFISFEKWVGKSSKDLKDGEILFDIDEDYWPSGKLNYKKIYHYTNNYESPGLILHEGYYENGKIQFRIDFQNGISERWHENGQLHYRIYFIRHATSHGTREYWYENGILSERGFYQDGSREGIQEGWTKDGKLSYKCNYSKDMEHGIQQKWDDDGKLIETYYLNGKEVPKIEFKNYKKDLGQKISNELNLNEKSLNDIIMEYL